MTDAHQRKLKQLDHHIRSASTLAHIIWYSGDAPAERSEKLNKRPDKVLHLLNHLAHCLVRVPRENVAVGLLTGSSRLVVSNSLLESPSTPDSKKSDENDTEELHRAACAGATLGASPSAAPSAKGSAATEENLHLDKIFEMICSHGTANKDKCGNPLDYVRAALIYQQRS